MAKAHDNSVQGGPVRGISEYGNSEHGNSEQARSEQEQLAIERIWRRYDADEVRLSRSLTDRMLECVELKRGDRVLDLASGRGEPAIPAAKVVGDAGHVIGVEPEPAMISMALERASGEGVSSLELVKGVAESADISNGAPYDAALCRWGLMYMQRPEVVIERVSKVLRPGGLWCIAVWGEVGCVPYFDLPRRALNRWIPRESEDCIKPGTFRFAAEGELESLLVSSGLKIVGSESHSIDVMEATSDDDLIEWFLAFGMQRFLQGLPPAVVAWWKAETIRLAQSYWSGHSYRIGGLTRLILAERTAE